MGGESTTNLMRSNGNEIQGRNNRIDITRNLFDRTLHRFILCDDAIEQGYILVHYNDIDMEVINDA